MKKTVINVRGVTKTYKLYSSKADRAVEIFLPFGKPRHKNHYALRDIDFDVFEGESVGIIGRNGSGKSTLLKILTGVLTATTGTVNVYGKVASLLELGAGFNPELTGRENVFFHGTLMGCTRMEIEDRIAEIIAFADIGEFIDQPVKVYSSGMFVRLAFAVSIHVDPDVLIIDEALAVGDVRFQKKCVDFMRKFKDGGKTILFVSHDIFTVKSFCNRLILLNDGQVEAIGDPDEVANRYYQIMFPQSMDVPAKAENSTEELHLSSPGHLDNYMLDLDLGGSANQWGDGAVWIKQLRVGGVRAPNLFGWQDSLEFHAVFQWDTEAVARICSEHAVPPRLLFGFRFENSQGWVITNFTNATLSAEVASVDLLATTDCLIRCRIAPVRLAAGNYFVTPGIAIGVLDSFFPVKEYSNLIHLHCDASVSVIGQMVLDYDIVVSAPDVIGTGRN